MDKIIDGSSSFINMQANNENRSHPEKQGNTKTAGNLNMRGIFLHVMADALGSVNVIISAIIMWQAPKWPYTIYVDPGIVNHLTTWIYLRQNNLCSKMIRIMTFIFSFKYNNGYYHGVERISSFDWISFNHSSNGTKSYRYRFTKAKTIGWCRWNSSRKFINCIWTIISHSHNESLELIRWNKVNFNFISGSRISYMEISWWQNYCICTYHMCRFIRIYGGIIIVIVAIFSIDQIKTNKMILRLSFDYFLF